jgi:superfamily II DNA or RNA helicase
MASSAALAGAALTSKPYVLPNRKAFADMITRTFLKYRTTQDVEDEDVDLCTRQGDTSRSTRDLFPYQRLVRDYLLIETPYRGILLYHGLGSGKTCTSIAVAESLLTNKKVFILLPASLSDNYRQEIRKCGDPIYIQTNYWEMRTFRTEEEKAPAFALGIPDDFLRSHGRYYVTIPGREPNFATLPGDIRSGIDQQIDAMIRSRYTFIHYNGLTKEKIMSMIPEEDPATSTFFQDSVVIIDEAHNLVSSVIDFKSEIRSRLYKAIYHAKNCKVVALSGTPIINTPNEIAYLMNLLRGPIERLSIPVKEIANWDESAMSAFFRKQREVDTIEYNSMKRIIQITRNPSHFKSVYNEKGERYAVQYDAELPQTSLYDWVDTLRQPFSDAFAGAVLGGREDLHVDFLECLPTQFADFVNMFLDGLEVKNALLFQRRIQGLVSYYRGGDERMLPKRVEDEKLLERIPMSDTQFTKYMEVRWKEIQQESKKTRGPGALNEDFSSYRVGTRLICDYAVPSEFKEPEEANEEKEPNKSTILAKLVAEPSKYFSKEGLSIYSPKMLRALTLIQESSPGNQFVYSQFRELEGLGLFAEVLKANGFQEYKLVKEDGKYKQDPTLDPSKQAFAFYTGKEDSDEREIMRMIFNEDYRSLNQNYPQHAQSLRESIAGKRVLSILMATSSGAEGINLKNVRHIHIIEPHWNPARHLQVVGRGIRLCSHATRDILDAEGRISTEIVPLEERTVRISFYMSVFTQEQSITTDLNGVPIRRADTRPKLYDAKISAGAAAPTAFMSSDEFLYEISYEKSRISDGISRLLKQAAVDCEIHRKLHSRGQPVLQCMRFDTAISNEDLAFHPSIKQDQLDASVLRNQIKRRRRLQKMKIKSILFVVDVDSNEVFDADSFLDGQRLLRLGIKEADRIQFELYA